MAEPKVKYYVVWQGKEPGIYTNWEQCRSQVDGVPSAMYKRYDTYQEAMEAYKQKPPKMVQIKSRNMKVNRSSDIITKALAVDAACSGNPGRMEFRGVWVESGEEAFHFGPYEKGTNNVGEFLALVYGIGLVQREGNKHVIYSDSMNAINWVMHKKCNTKLPPCAANQPIFELIEKSEKWLKNTDVTARIYKWNTEEWGEIPADFGRK